MQFIRFLKLLLIIFLLNIILFNSLLIGDSQACNRSTDGSKITISDGACDSNSLWLILGIPEDSVEISDNTRITFPEYSYPISVGGSGGTYNSSVINRGVIIQNNYHSVITFYDGSGMSLSLIHISEPTRPY